MKIFVFNRGSGSIKCALYEEMEGKLKKEPVWTALLRWKNQFDEPLVKIRDKEEEVSYPVTASSVQEAFALLLSALRRELKGESLGAIGHRVAHGGALCKESLLVDEEVKKSIRTLGPLAPLHNPQALEGIEWLSLEFPLVPQIAVFDTAFHHTLSQAASAYAIPYQWYEEGIRRYGFHGISFQYCVRQAQVLLGKEVKRVLICHLGSGSSLCAVKEGKSFDTTMGFTPLEGVIMATRSGTIDPGILLYMQQEKKKSVQELSSMLYEESGLLGLGGSSDIQDVLRLAKEGEGRSLFTMEVYLHNLYRMMGSMIASLQGLDLLIFTAGIGENAALIRKRVVEQFSFLQLSLNDEENERASREDRRLTGQGSKVEVLLIHTQESLEIARECLSVLKKT